MVSGYRGAVVREVARVFSHGTAAASEGGLLARFAVKGDRDALEGLVTRHGPTVLGVCRRMLRDPNDVEDAFQATFLVLFKKAGSLRDDDGLGPWLHGVARKVAARVRAEAARRPAREHRAARAEAVPARSESDDLKAVLDEEIARLPEKYRKPVVLCYLEGRTLAEAASRLRWTPGTLRGRLDRGRDRLRSSLARRGLAPPAGLIAPAMIPTIPPSLMAATIAVAVGAPAGRAAALAKGVLRSMFLIKLKIVAAFVLAGVGALLTLPIALEDKAPRHANQAMTDDEAVSVTGRVLGLEGQPIAGARVARGSDLRGPHDPEAITDAWGKFAFRNVKPGALILTVQAAGYATDLKEVEAGKDKGSVEFRLGPGQSILGRIVDPAGKPIAGAPVAADSWRGHHSLRWMSETDLEGRFRFDHAPPDVVLIDLGSLGYFPHKRFASMTAGAAEVTIGMRRPLSVRGAVTDAETGKPVGGFTVVPGIDWGQGQPPQWERGQALGMTGGAYHLNLSTQYPLRVLRVEAEGYLPALSRGFKEDEGDAVFDFKLRRGDWLKGVVRLPDGSPLAGADVVMVTSTIPAGFRNGRPPEGGNHHVVKTDADGRFAFPRQEPPFRVIAVDDRGFAGRTAEELSASREIRLRPWGRVEGVVRVGRKPGSGEKVYLSPPRTGGDSSSFPYTSDRATADESGRFTFDRVVPGEVTVSRVIGIGPNASGISSEAYSHATIVDVTPGGTARVTIGGTGRPVVGRVDIPADLADQVDPSNNLNSLVAGPERRKANGTTRVYAMKLEPDGSFRVDDVEPGVYFLDIAIHGRATAESHPAIGGEVIGSVRREVTVPPIPEGRSDEPLDLGTIRIERPR